MAHLRNRARRTPPVRHRRLTFSWAYPIVLTHRCAWRCGYCSFPVTIGPPLPSKNRVEQWASRARALGISQLRVTAGEGIENNPEIMATYRFYGFGSLAEYLKAILNQVAQNKVVPPLFPELDLGALSLAQMQQLRPLVFTMRLYLESMDPQLQYGAAHGQSEGKWPRHRLSSLLSAGRLRIPVNSGLMVGIGESEKSREKTLRTLAEVARRYGHIQSVRVQPFEPTPNTAMSEMPGPTVETLLAVVALARKILPPGVAVQFPIVSCPERVMDFVGAGVDDLGDFELTGQPASDAPVMNAYRIVSDRLQEAKIELADRLSLFPKFSNPQWITPRYRQLLLCGQNPPEVQESVAEPIEGLA